MYSKINIISIFCLSIVSCINTNFTVVKTISIDANLDTLKFQRTIRITKNTLTDTIIFGQGVLRPNFIGNIKYTKLENRNDISLDLDYSNPPADRICISSYKKKKVKVF